MKPDKFDEKAREIISNYFVVANDTDSKPECLLRDVAQALREAAALPSEDALDELLNTEPFFHWHDEKLSLLQISAKLGRLECENESLRTRLAAAPSKAVEWPSEIEKYWQLIVAGLKSLAHFDERWAASPHSPGRTIAEQLDGKPHVNKAQVALDELLECKSRLSASGSEK